MSNAIVKNLNFGSDAKDKVFAGITKLTQAVSSTLGASGKCVILEDNTGKPIITKDGVTVAEAVTLLDPVENMGATLLKEAARKTVKEAGDVVVLATDGYLNNIGGEKISEVCDQHMENGKNTFLINLEKTSVVNSIGVSILIEIIEKLQESDGKLAYCNLAPIVEKTFNIMGLTKYSTIYSTEEEGLSDLSS